MRCVHALFWVAPMAHADKLDALKVGDEQASKLKSIEELFEGPYASSEPILN